MVDFVKGDLISFFRGNGEKRPGLITRVGGRVSMYVEDRPYRIIDTRSYTVLSMGKSMTIYDYQIEDMLSSKEIRENV